MTDVESVLEGKHDILSVKNLFFCTTQLDSYMNHTWVCGGSGGGGCYGVVNGAYRLDASSPGRVTMTRHWDSGWL